MDQFVCEYIQPYKLPHLAVQYSVILYFQINILSNAACAVIFSPFAMSEKKVWIYLYMMFCPCDTPWHIIARR